ncbi:hypothetical protein [Ruegeria lacuscaerulensis]|uniref:hypothetical protein n=1 Tax=Ruegeria lacuscaerulensis TaxID=55218 RepID=UPI00147DE97C|nr:hypothetical protein [Ruegeria lacuscaerulensis]
MRTGQSGRVAISWAQTELDGLEGAPLSFMAVGAVWSWRGHILCVEEFTDTAKGLRARLPDHFISEQELDGDALGVIVLTNGAQQYSALLHSVGTLGDPVLVFENGLPMREQEFWVDEVIEIRVANDHATGTADTVIAFPTRPSMASDIHPVPRLPAVNAAQAMD